MIRKAMTITITACSWKSVLSALAADPPGPAIPLDSVTLDSSKLRVHFVDIGPGSPAALRPFATAGIEASHVLRMDEGDSIPELSSERNPRGDDRYVFETDGDTATRILRVKVGD